MVFIYGLCFVIYNFPLFSFKLEFEVNLQLQIALDTWFYSVPLFSVKSMFRKNVIASLLLIPVITQQ